MESAEESPAEEYKYHSFGIKYETIGQTQPLKRDDLPAIFATGSPDWNSTLMDILDWYPDKEIAAQETEALKTSADSVLHNHSPSADLDSRPLLNGNTYGDESNDHPYGATLDSESVLDEDSRKHEPDDRPRVQVSDSGSLLEGNSWEDGPSVVSLPPLLDSRSQKGSSPSSKIDMPSNDLNEDDTARDDLTSVGPFECPITDCEKKYAQPGSVHRHAVTAHPTYIFKFWKGTWTVTQKLDEETQIALNKQSVKRKTPCSEGVQSTHSAKRQKQKQSSTQAESDRGDSASPMVLPSPLPYLNNTTPVVDSLALVDHAMDDAGIDVLPNSGLLHGIAEAAKDDGDEDEANELALTPNESLAGLTSSEHATDTPYVVEQETPPLSLQHEAPLNESMDLDQVLSPLSSVETPERSMECDELQLHEVTAHRLTSGDFDDLSDMDVDVDIANSFDELGEGGDGRQELVRSHYFTQSRTKVDDSIGDVDSPLSPRVKQSLPAKQPRKPRLSADRLVMIGGFENAQDVGGLSDRKKSQKGDPEGTKASTIKTRSSGREK